MSLVNGCESWNELKVELVVARRCRVSQHMHIRHGRGARTVGFVDEMVACAFSRFCRNLTLRILLQGV